MVPKVIDLSHHNSIPESLVEAKESGIIGVVHKFSEGDDYIDDKVQARYYLAKEAGLAWGLYHFLRPGDMQDQASFFVNEAIEHGVLDENTMLAADHEDERVSYADLIEFLEAVEHHSGRKPVIYSGHVLKEQVVDYPDEYRLWLAQYSSSPTLPAGCSGYYMWQYSDAGKVPGVTPPTDVNAIALSDAEFLRLWSGKEMTPEPDDDIPVVSMFITAAKPVKIKITWTENVEVVYEDD